MSNVENEYAWKVCVRCFTFNHAPYIEDAMNGFCMQETDFPFVCTIVDDASTDGEQEVIKKYLEDHFDLEDKSIVRNEETEYYTLTFARHKTNKNCYFAVLYLKYNHYSKPKIKDRKFHYISEWHENCKYIALCEGDDYWIDGKKLQMQVDFLENNPQISYTCTRYKILVQSTGVISEGANYYYEKNGNRNEYFEFTKKDAFTKGWITKTLTSVFRAKYYDSRFLSQFEYARDVHIVYMLLSSGNGVCFSSFSGVYRLNSASTFGGKSQIEQIIQNYNVYEEFYRKTRDNVLKYYFVEFYVQLLNFNVIPNRLPEKKIRYFEAFIYIPIFFVRKLLSKRSSEIRTI